MFDVLGQKNFGRILMIYVMSDLHGCYDKYISMINKIGLCSEDTLYVLGDVVDRGPNGIKYYSICVSVRTWYS